jgi:hypothetical protein
MTIEDDNNRDSKAAIDSLQMSDEDLLKEIFSLTKHVNVYPLSNISRALAYFSSLLTKLSRQAEESTNKTIKLTKQIY